MYLSIYEWNADRAITPTLTMPYNSSVVYC